MRSANLWRSFSYAFAGLAYVFRTQRNFRVHLAIALPAIAIGLYVGLSGPEWAVLTLIITLVLFAEMLNTVVESTIDLASPEYHPLAKVAKDVAAGAVLLTAIAALIVGLLLLGPHLFRLALP